MLTKEKNSFISVSSTTNESTVEYLAQTDPKAIEVTNQFNAAWRHPTASPTVICVLKINPSQHLLSRYLKYREQVIADEPSLKDKGKGLAGPGNEHRRFHGTSGMTCQLGLTPKNTTLCNGSSCNVCQITKTGLKLSKSGSQHAFGRFGAGIYFSSTSSKSNDYNANTAHVLGGAKSMFLFKVIVGKGMKLHSDNPNLKSAPPGYHSVLGEVGGSLNYDELVIYNEEAILPAYILTYK